MLLELGCWFSFRVYPSLLAPFSNLQSANVLFSRGPVVSVVASPLEFCLVLGFRSRVGFRVGKVAAQVFTPAWLVVPSFGPSLVNAALVNSKFPVADEALVPPRVGSCTTVCGWLRFYEV